MARLTPEQWKTIQARWEFDIDEPSYDIAAARAAKEHGFKSPAKSSVYEKQQKEGWARKGNMIGLNQAAQRKADTLVDANGNDTKPNKQNGTERKGRARDGSKPNGVRNELTAVSSEKAAEQSANQEAADRQQSLDVRAEVTVRHRKEWGQIVMLRQEAMLYRDKKNHPSLYDLGTYYGLLKSAKLAAEVTAIQQAGERKAWGMDVLVDPDTVKKMSNEQLEKIAAGGNA